MEPIVLAGLLLSLILILSVINTIFYKKFLHILEDNFPSKYTKIGFPSSPKILTIFYLGNIIYMGFVLSRKYKELKNDKLTSLGNKILIIQVAKLIITILFLYIIISLRINLQG